MDQEKTCTRCRKIWPIDNFRSICGTHRITAQCLKCRDLTLTSKKKVIPTTKKDSYKRLLQIINNIDQQTLQNACSKADISDLEFKNIIQLLS